MCIVGAGKMSRLLLKHLAAKGCKCAPCHLDSRQTAASSVLPSACSFIALALAASSTCHVLPSDQNMLSACAADAATEQHHLGLTASICIHYVQCPNPWPLAGTSSS